MVAHKNTHIIDTGYVWVTDSSLRRRWLQTAETDNDNESGREKLWFEAKSCPTDWPCREDANSVIKPIMSCANTKDFQKSSCPIFRNTWINIKNIPGLPVLWIHHNTSSETGWVPAHCCREAFISSTVLYIKQNYSCLCFSSLSTECKWAYVSVGSVCGSKDSANTSLHLNWEIRRGKVLLLKHLLWNLRNSGGLFEEPEHLWLFYLPIIWLFSSIFLKSCYCRATILAVED